MAGKITWAIGSFIGGALAYGLAKYLFDEDKSKVVYCKSDMSDEVLESLFEKLNGEKDAKGLYELTRSSGFVVIIKIKVVIIWGML